MTGLDLLEPEEAAALAAAVESLRADLGDDVRIGLFGSRARRDHRPESDFDLLCLMPDGLAVDFEVVDNNVVSAMAEYGGAANVQYLQESRLEDLYFEHAYLPNALREWIDVTDPCLLVLAASEV